MTVQVKKTRDLTLADKLSRLTFTQACDLLGGIVEGKKLLYAGGKVPTDSLKEQALLMGDLFRLSLGEAIVTITLKQDKVKRLHIHCDRCEGTCIHMGTTLSTILESKVALGLARTPEERKPVEALSEEELVERALEERRQRARDEKMTLEAVNRNQTSIWGDYIVTSKLSGKSYGLRFAARNRERILLHLPRLSLEYARHL